MPFPDTSQHAAGLVVHCSSVCRSIPRVGRNILLCSAHIRARIAASEITSFRQTRPRLKAHHITYSTKLVHLYRAIHDVVSWTKSAPLNTAACQFVYTAHDSRTQNPGSNSQESTMSGAWRRLDPNLPLLGVGGKGPLHLRPHAPAGRRLLTPFGGASHAVRQIFLQCPCKIFVQALSYICEFWLFHAKSAHLLFVAETYTEDGFGFRQCICGELRITRTPACWACQTAARWPLVKAWMEYQPHVSTAPFRVGSCGFLTIFVFLGVCRTPKSAKLPEASAAPAGRRHVLHMRQKSLSGVTREHPQETSRK